jgi:transposase
MRAAKRMKRRGPGPGNGFWLYYRRLDSGRFKWPKQNSGQSAMAVSRRQLQWLLDGLALEQHKAHPEVLARITI